MKQFGMIAVVTAAVLVSTSVWAGGPYHGGYPGGGWYRGGYYGGYYGPRVGVVIGGPVWGPWYYPPPYYYPPYPPAVVAVPTTPPVYIERGQPGPGASSSAGTWYYCPDSKGYYPYVNQCSSGWQAVPATPPQAAPGR
jgi:hypothetical protein